jgi:5-methylcytosine-specific restriction endonuclease McrBC regulatory subunit McrC
MAPTEILLAIGAAEAGPAGYAASVDLFEHQTALFDLPLELSGSDTADLNAFLSAQSLQGLLKVGVVHRPDGRPQLRIVTDSRVGFGSARSGMDRIFVRVRPKIDTQRFLELAFLADTLPTFDLQTDVASADFGDILRWMLEIFVRSMERLIAQGGLRPTHERVNQVLRNRVRGKLQIPAFMASLAKGQPDRIACQFSALVFDNRANRLLKWALAAAGKMSRDLIPDARFDARLVALERHFGEVPLVRPSRSALEREDVLPPNQRHYAPVIRIAKMLLAGFHVDSSAGAVPSISLSADMNVIFERAFWNLTKINVASARPKPSWRMDFAAAGGTPGLFVNFEPDIFVPPSPDRAPLVVDTKWKSAVQPYQTESLIRPSTADIYQVATYAGSVLRDQSATKRCFAVLMYPSLVDCAVLDHRIKIGDFETIVVVMAWNVAQSPLQAVGKIWEYLDALRLYHQPDEVQSIEGVEAGIPVGVDA